MISTLRRKPCKKALHRMGDSRSYIVSGLTCVSPCWSILISNIHPSLALNSSKSMVTGSVTSGIPNAIWTDLGNNRFLRHGGQLQRPTSWMAFPIPEPPRTHKLTPVSTRDSPGSSKYMGLRIPQSSGENIPPWELFTPLWL